MKTRDLTTTALAALLLGACVTAPPSQNEGRVAEVIELINDGSVQALVDQSHVPFFFDAELLVRSTDVDLMWAGFRDAGVEISPVGFAVEPAAPGDYSRIADTFDMQTFFSPDRYFPEDAGWVIADSSVGELLILLGDRNGRLPVIFGIARSSNE